MAIRYLLAQSLVALSLSFLTCLTIEWHLRRSRAVGTAGRVAVDLALLLALLLGPWLVAKMLDGRAAPDLAHLLVGPGFLVRLAPCASALLAGISFGWLATRPGRWHVQQVA